MIAPASRIRAAGGASSAAGSSVRAAVPSGTGVPLVAMFSLIVDRDAVERQGLAFRPAPGRCRRVRQGALGIERVEGVELGLAARDPVEHGAHRLDRREALCRVGGKERDGGEIRRIVRRRRGRGGGELRESLWHGIPRASPAAMMPLAAEPRQPGSAAAADAAHDGAGLALGTPLRLRRRHGFRRRRRAAGRLPDGAFAGRRALRAARSPLLADDRPARRSAGGRPRARRLGPGPPSRAGPRRRPPDSWRSGCGCRTPRRPGSSSSGCGCRRPRRSGSPPCPGLRQPTGRAPGPPPPGAAAHRDTWPCPSRRRPRRAL